MAGSLAFAPVASAAALTSSQVQSILGLLTSFGADSATIANVQSALTGSPVVSTVDTTTKAGVTALQKELIAQGYDIPAITKGGVAYGFYGAQTKAAQAARAKAQASNGSSTSTTTPVVGTTVKVGLSSSSPSGSVLVATQGIGKIAEFAFTNTSASPVNVTALTFKRIGVSNDSALDNVYLYNGVTRLTDSAGVSNSSFTFSDPTALFTVPANSTYIVAVRADIASGTSGQQVGAQLVSATSNGTLEATYPISSGLQTISNALLSGVTLTPTGADSFISPQASYTIWQDTVEVSNNAANLMSIKFTNLGTTDSSNVKNLRLFVDGVQVSTAALAADRTATFDLSANPTSLSTQSHTVKVIADIVKGASRTVKFSLQRPSDLMIVDGQLNQPVRPTFTSTTVYTTTINAVTPTSGVSVSLDPASPSSDVAKDATNIKLASFDFLASGEDVKVNDLFVYANVPLQNGKIRVNGVQIGSAHNLVASTTPAGTDFSLGSSLILPADQTTRVDIYADTKTTASSVQITLVAGSSNAQGQSSLNSANVPATNISSNVLNVSASNLSVTKASGYGPQTVIPGSVAKIGEFNLSAGATEGISVNTVTLAFPVVANAASTTNLTLKDKVSQAVLGTVVTTPSSSNSFSVNLSLPSSTTKAIEVYANILSGANNGTIQVNASASGVGALTGTTANSGVQGLQLISVGTGTFSASVGAGDPVSANVLAGASNVNVGQFTFYAANSAYTVQDLDVLVNHTGAMGNVTVSYKDAAGATQTASQPLNGSDTASFRGLAIFVPTNDQADLNVSVSIPTIASGAQSDSTINATLKAANFRAIDSSGRPGATITDKASAGTFYVRKSIPTFAMLATGTTVPTSGNPLYRFSVTADKAGAIDWKQVTFNVSTSSTAVTNLYLVDEASGLSIGTATTTGNTATVTLATAQQVAANSTKTYALQTNDGIAFGAGASLAISLKPDTVDAATGNTLWSDRSTVGNFTNGYLLKNFTTNATSYSK